MIDSNNSTNWIWTNFFRELATLRSNSRWLHEQRETVRWKLRAVFVFLLGSQHGPDI